MELSIGNMRSRECNSKRKKIKRANTGINSGGLSNSPRLRAAGTEWPERPSKN